jgi:hypothetical protein
MTEPLIVSIMRLYIRFESVDYVIHNNFKDFQFNEFMSKKLNFPKAGANSCNEQWLFNSQYWNKFRQCHISSHGSYSFKFYFI